MSLEFQNEPQGAERIEQKAEEAVIVQPTVPLYSFILIACYVAVFAVQLYVDSQDKEFEGIKSLILAGLVKPFFADGQYWRILTAGVMHGGVMHLFFNSYATYVFGNTFETLSNRAHLIIVFLLAVIGGGIFSQIFLPTGVSIGASGGILGFLGYLAIYAFKRRKLLSSEFTKNILINIGLITFFGVVVIPNTDNWAHLGGFLTGAIYALFQVPGDLYKDPRIISKTTDLISKVALGVLFLICLFAILAMLEIIKISLPLQLLQ